MLAITDSLIYDIKTEDFYTDLTKNLDILTKLDTSNLTNDDPCYYVERKKKPGTFINETKGKIISKLVALRAKSYSFNLAGVEIIKSKGVRKHAIKNHMTLDDHKQCLFWGEEQMNADKCN